MKFDNIATLKKEDGKWVVDRVWELQSWKFLLHTNKTKTSGAS
jgi:hypothetical protein